MNKVTMTKPSKLSANTRTRLSERGRDFLQTMPQGSTPRRVCFRGFRHIRRNVKKLNHNAPNGGVMYSKSFRNNLWGHCYEDLLSPIRRFGTRRPPLE